jgi:hypothetical protein
MVIPVLRTATSGVTTDVNVSSTSGATCATGNCKGKEMQGKEKEKTERRCIQVSMSIREDPMQKKERCKKVPG